MMYLNSWQLTRLEHEYRVKALDAENRLMTESGSRVQRRKPAWLESLRHIVQPSQEQS